MDAYLAAKPGVSVTALSRQIIPGNGKGHHPRLIQRIRDGEEVMQSAAEQASHWFPDNWPDHVPWPDDVPRPKSEAEAAE